MKNEICKQLPEFWSFTYSSYRVIIAASPALGYVLGDSKYVGKWLKTTEP